MSDPFGSYRNDNGDLTRPALDNIGRDIARSGGPLPQNDLDRLRIVERERITQVYQNEKNRSGN